MTTIIHPVGNGDLGINITHIPRPERLTAQKNAETEILQKIRCRNTLDLVSVLTKDQTRTAPTPLALTLASLERPLQDVHILLYGTNQGVSGTETNTIAHLLEKAMNLPEVKKNIEEKYGLRFDVQVIGDGGLQEETRTSSLDETLRNIPSTEDVIVNGISAATMTVLSIMGTVDRLGFNWRLSASPGMTENKAIFAQIARLSYRSQRLENGTQQNRPHNYSTTQVSHKHSQQISRHPTNTHGGRASSNRSPRYGARRHRSRIGTPRMGRKTLRNPSLSRARHSEV